jgi:hypothetical protein
MMKDIQREVKALELAMEIATDVSGKPYAYTVARIQEALLGRSEVEKAKRVDFMPVPILTKSKWDFYASRCIDGRAILEITTPYGVSTGYTLYEGSYPGIASAADKFCMASRQINELKEWSVIALNGNRIDILTDQFTVTLSPNSGTNRSVLLELKDYLESLRD